MLKRILTEFAVPSSGKPLSRSRALGRAALAAAVVLAAGAYSSSGAAIFQTRGAKLRGQGPGICPSNAIALSSCTKDSSGNLEIGASGCGPTVYVDKTLTGDKGFKGTITIDSGASLCFPDQTVKLDVNTILVSGLLQIGQKTHPIGTSDPATLITVNFTGTRPCAAGTTCPNFSKGIQVQSSGSLEMFGLKGVPPNGLNWTYLSQSAGPKTYGKGTGVTAPVGVTSPDSLLHVADDVTQGTGRWQDGDWIAIGSTSFSPYDTETVKIATILAKPADNPTGSDIILTDPTKLVHYHFGSVAPTPSQLCTVNSVPTYFACGSAPTGCTSACISQPSLINYNDPATSNYGVDERAPVALLSRNILLTATIEGQKDDPANDHWGGETQSLQGFKEVSMQGVQMAKFGKDQLGSYPIHFHMDMDVSSTPPLVDSNSIDHSYNKCITVHTTQNLTISNNVCVRVVGHLFYEEIGDESGVTYQNNLGMGAMSNSFDIYGNSKLTRDQLIDKYWWTGDNLTNAGNEAADYNGFNVPDTDATNNPTHGSCTTFLRSGQLGGYVPPEQSATNQAACAGTTNPIYIEPASGFWITNPKTVLTGNIIDGCQGVGVGYWYVPPVNGQPIYPAVNFNQYLPVGAFRDNRVSACFDGLFGENAYSESSSSLLHPTVDGTPATRNLLTEFDGLTATRIRDRGVWMRDQWFVVNDGRFATSRDNASLLTAGGIDGATPGDWMLTENSVFQGISQNNVDRFGPCPNFNTSFPSQAPLAGCVDQTPPGQNDISRSGDEVGKGYPDPNWNMFGYMIYDGPARLIKDRFVDFNVVETLTNDDGKALAAWKAANTLVDQNGNKVPWVYEGDAAFGWFQSNQSSYPTLANVSQLSFVNTDLRHQIYTQLVNLGKNPSNPTTSGFGDGDQNTAVIDLDGTLDGFSVADTQNNNTVGTRFDDAHPISLNGLLINASSNSVDECLAEGGQDTVLENRPTALMSPSSMATLEFSMLYPPANFQNPPPPGLQKQEIIFTKDATDAGIHDTMTLTSRNALGVWEPKVTSGLSYTTTAAIDTPNKGDNAGMSSIIELGLVDAYKPAISPSNPFYVRVGICYSSANGEPASPSSFTIARGFHSYGGGTIGMGTGDLELRQFYNKLSNLYVDSSGNHENCDNLVGNNLVPGPTKTNTTPVPINLACPSNPVPSTGCPYTAYNPPPNTYPQTGCPADGIALQSAQTGGNCPTGTTAGTDVQGQAVCVFPTDTLVAATNGIGDLTNNDGTYNSTVDANGRTGLDKYFYDPNSGWLFLYVAQTEPNPEAPSPLADCQDQSSPNPACPNVANGETYYVCPPEGCHDYVITVTDPNYEPGVSNCAKSPYAGGFGAPEPPARYELVLNPVTNPPVPAVRNPIPTPVPAFPHYSGANAPICETTTSD